MEEVLLAETNKAMRTLKKDDITWGELVRYLGLWLLMATVNGFSRDDFWDPEPFNQETKPCPYRLNKYMSKRRFNLINPELRFTNIMPLRYHDPFWQIRQMVKEWNSNMAAFFVCSWAICLDESMSIWYNRWTCPGWIFCPRKLHPFGNEWHTACCALCGVMFVIMLLEGKERPRELGWEELDKLGGKTVGLLLQMLKSYFATGKYVILDSGFCVLKALVELWKRGLFACALIKKRRYWPTLVPGDEMERHFAEEGKVARECDAIQGTMDGVVYNLWGMKEPNYVM